VPDDLTRKFEGLQRSLETTVADLGRKLGKRLDQMGQQLGRLAASAQEAAQTQKQIQRQLDALDQQVTAFIGEERAARRKLFAQTALVDVRAEHDRRFGHRQMIRRNTTGMLRAMTAGTVRPAAFLRAAEQLMFDATGYWLPPAQVALAAWVANSPVSAERAVLEATSRDPGRSALFFSLVLARFGRQDAAACWIAEYAKAQDGNALTGEFTAVLDAVARGALGDPARERLLDACRGWRDQIGQSDEREARQVASWMEFIRGQRQPLTDTFGVLGTVSHDWVTTLGRLKAAAAFCHTEQWLQDRLSCASEGEETLRAVIDELLRDLIAAPDQAESALLEAAKVWQAILKRGGRPPVPTSRESGELVRTDFLTLATAIAMSAQASEFSEQAVRFCLILSRASVERAITDLSKLVSSTYPASIEVDVEGWHHAMKPGDDPDALVLQFLNWAREAMREDEAQATRRRLNIGRNSARLDNIKGIWEARKQGGHERVDLATRQVNVFFARWEQGIAAARRCVDLLRAQPAGAWSDARESPAIGAPRLAMELPEWDPRPLTLPNAAWSARSLARQRTVVRGCSG
jgi:hypothetical protein